MYPSIQVQIAQEMSVESPWTDAHFPKLPIGTCVAFERLVSFLYKECSTELWSLLGIVHLGLSLINIRGRIEIQMQKNT